MTKEIFFWIQRAVLPIKNMLLVLSKLSATIPQTHYGSGNVSLSRAIF